MKQTLNDTITITHQMGGIMEFERTGIYPNKLLIKSVKYKQTWVFRLKDGQKIGSVKKNGKVVYNFIFDGHQCKVQPINNGIPDSDWYLVEDMMIMMCD